MLVRARERASRRSRCGPPSPHESSGDAGRGRADADARATDDRRYRRPDRRGGRDGRRRDGSHRGHDGHPPGIGQFPFRLHPQDHPGLEAPQRGEHPLRARRPAGASGAGGAARHGTDPDAGGGNRRPRGRGLLSDAAGALGRDAQPGRRQTHSRHGGGAGRDGADSHGAGIHLPARRGGGAPGHRPGQPTGCRDRHDGRARCARGGGTHPRLRPDSGDRHGGYLASAAEQSRRGGRGAGPRPARGGGTPGDHLLPPDHTRAGHAGASARRAGRSGARAAGQPDQRRSGGHAPDPAARRSRGHGAERPDSGATLVLRDRAGVSPRARSEASGGAAPAGNRYGGAPQPGIVARAGSAARRLLHAERCRRSSLGVASTSAG